MRSGTCCHRMPTVSQSVQYHTALFQQFMNILPRPLLEQQGFPSDEGHQMVLLDEAGMDSMRRPTLYNMRKAIQWLTSDAQTGHADHGVFFCVWESWIVMCMSEYQ